jgi:hypothetical protein
MLSDKACSLLRDFMLVFDLDKFFKGSTEVTESDAGKVLEYMTSVFEQASLLAPTTYMSPKGDMYQAQQSTSVERAIWQDIVQWILHPALRVQVQMLVEFGGDLLR